MLIKCYKINVKKVLIFLAVLLGVLGIAGAFAGSGGKEPKKVVQTSLTQSGTPLPIFMYHHMLKDEQMLSKYVISEKELENDLMYLKENGYTTILPKELLAFCKEGVPLPPKPVMLTFDDGYLTTLAYALPILQKYEAKAVVSCVGAYADRFTKTPDPSLNYGHLTWEDMKELAASPLIEIGNHSYNMHTVEGRKGIRKKEEETIVQYKTALYDDVFYMESLLRERLGKGSGAFTYPFGAMGEESCDILEEMGFEVIFTCAEKVNYLTGNSKELLSLSRFNRPHNFAIASVLKEISYP